MDCEPQYLDPDEEFELMHAEELDLLKEFEKDHGSQSSVPRKSLNFDNIPVNKQNYKDNYPSPTVDVSNNVESNNSSFPLSWYECQPSTSSSNKGSITKTSPLPNLDFDISPKILKEKPSTAILNGVSNKRSIDELFGDINDIDFLDDTDSTFNNNKRTKIDPVDKDLLVISKIQAKRKKMHEYGKQLFTVCSDIDFEPTKVEVSLTRRVPKYEFFTLRNGKGEKFYAKLHSDLALCNKIISVSEECKHFQLLSIPFENIMMEANELLAKKLSKEDEKSYRPENSETEILNAGITDLWVEKYKPLSYVELLSNEETNRVLLKWIKLWDKVVFNKENSVRKNKNLVKKTDNRFRWKNSIQLDEELDDSGCPKYKIALLCGAPGLGKTTFAHLISKNAGYNVIEVNASDDRSPEAFESKLKDCTEIKYDANYRRPQCLIFDEIDGAPPTSIEVLVKFVKGEGRKRQKKKNTSQNVQTLKRPIICICNDVYVAALRPLRQIAFVVHFPPTDLSRLTQRLVDIARMENIDTDCSAMMALCKIANNDIRTCLSTLYCLKNQPIRLSTIEKTYVGNKDMHKGLFTVWQEIFQIQDSKKFSESFKAQNKNKTESELFLVKRMQSILASVQGNGDYDRLIQGVFENYLNMNFQNSQMPDISKGLEWFCFVDEIKTKILTTQNYVLLPYTPFCFVIWHFLFSSYQRPKLTYPRMFYEIYTRQTKYQQIVQDVLKGMDPKIRAYCNEDHLLMDTLPYLTYLLNPNLRSINSTFFNDTEKKILNQIINMMTDYNFNFIQERTEDGDYDFSLDPNIEEVVCFPNILKPRKLTYFLKLMISREVDQEKLRRFQNLIMKNTNSNSDTSIPKTKNNLFASMKNDDNSILPEVEAEISNEKKQNHLQKLTPKMVKENTSSTVAKDFFGRIIDKSKDIKTNSTKIDDIVKSDVWFHFKEGYSNAVRRPVYMKDLY